MNSRDITCYLPHDLKGDLCSARKAKEERLIKEKRREKSPPRLLIFSVGGKDWAGGRKRVHETPREPGRGAAPPETDRTSKARPGCQLNHDFFSSCFLVDLTLRPCPHLLTGLQRGELKSWNLSPTQSGTQSSAALGFNNPFLPCKHSSPTASFMDSRSICSQKSSEV